MRRAEWRRRADDPTTLFGWWWRGFWAEGWPAYLLPGVGLWIAVATGLPSIAAGAMGLMILMQGVRFARSTDRLAPMLPMPAPEDQFRATVVYRRSGLTTGEDTMALTVVDGWLVGEGLRTDFALRPREVRALSFGANWKASLLLSDGGEIRLLGVLKPSEVTLQEWHSNGLSPEGEPTFPPMFVHSAPFVRWLGWCGVGFLAISLLNATKPFLHLPAELVVTMLMLGMGAVFWGGKQFFRLAKITGEARKEAVARIPEGTSIHVEVLGTRVEIKGEALAKPLGQNELFPDLSPQPPLQEEPLGEGESVRA